MLSRLLHNQPYTHVLHLPHRRQQRMNMGYCCGCCLPKVITPKTGEAFLKLRLKDQAASLQLLDDDPNLKGMCTCCIQQADGCRVGGS